MKHPKRMTIIVLVLISVFIFGCSQSGNNQNGGSGLNNESNGKATETLAEPTATKTAQPSSTPNPTNTPIPGWNKVNAGRISMYFPESYVGGDPKNDLEFIIERIDDLGPEFSQYADMIEQNPEQFLIWMLDSDIGPSGGVANINVATEDILSAITIEMIFDITVEQFPIEIQNEERSTFEFQGYEAGSLRIDLEVNNVEVSEMFYIIKDTNTVWLITCAASTSEIDDRLPQFEQIFRSIEIQPE